MKRRSFLACCAGGVLATMVMPGSWAHAQVISKDDPEYTWFVKWVQGGCRYADCTLVDGQPTLCGHFNVSDPDVRVLSNSPDWILRKYPKVTIQCNEKDCGPEDYIKR
jgi:hypothetical protein